MATPPFNPDETKPAPSDLISAYPTVEQTFRDIIESWILFEHSRDGTHDKVTLDDKAASPPAGTAGKVTLYNSGGTVVKMRQGTGTAGELVDTFNAQTIGGVKTFSAAVTFNAAVTLNSTLGLTGNLTITKTVPQIDLTEGARTASFLYDDTSNAIFVRTPTTAGKRQVIFETQGSGNLVEGAKVRKSGSLHEFYSRFDIASQAVAEAGADNDAIMTPLRVAQAITAQGALQFDSTVAASGTAVDFTGLPSTTKRITIAFFGVSLNGSDDMLVQIGDAGGFETTGYASSSTKAELTGGSSSAGFLVRLSNAGADFTGTMTLISVDPSVNTSWVSSHNGSSGSGGVSTVGGGRKTLSALLTQVRITSTSGTNTFDAGNISVYYE